MQLLFWETILEKNLPPSTSSGGQSQKKQVRETRSIRHCEESFMCIVAKSQNNPFSGHKSNGDVPVRLRLSNLFII